MAKQTGPHTLEGTIGNITFYNDPDYGPLARQKSCLNGKKISENPRFTNTMHNAAEFGRAIAGARLLRAALRPVLLHIADRGLSGRMNARFLQAVRSDNSHRWGERCLQNGTQGLLEGFQFNKSKSLQDAFPLSCTHHIDAVTGHMYSRIPSFIPGQLLQPPAGARYFTIVSMGASLDFGKEKPEYSLQATGLIGTDRPTVLPALRLQHAVEATAGDWLFLVAGIVFYASPGDIPPGLLSKNKRRHLKQGDGPVAYTGSLEIARVLRATGADAGAH